MHIKVNVGRSRKPPLRPKPIQSPHPPMWIAARDPDSHKFAVANGCHVMVTPLWQSDEEVVNLAQRFQAALAENPDVPRPQLMLLRHTFVGANEQEVEQAMQAHSRFYGTFEEWFKNQRPIKDGFIAPLSAAEFAEKVHFSPELMRKQLVIDTPENVIQRLQAYENLGVDQYSFWIDNGQSHAEKKRSLELFIKEVAPAFK